MFATLRGLIKAIHLYYSLNHAFTEVEAIGPMNFFLEYTLKKKYSRQYIKYVIYKKYISFQNTTQVSLRQNEPLFHLKFLKLT